MRHCFVIGALGLCGAACSLLVGDDLSNAGGQQQTVGPGAGGSSLATADRT